VKPYRVRVEVSDHPDALSPVRSAIASAGGSVVSEDLYEVDGEQVVDELVVEMRDELDHGDLARVIETTGVATLLSSRRTERSGDPLVRALGWARAILASDRGIDGLTEAVSQSCNAKSWVCEEDDARVLPAGRLALDRERSIVRRSSRPDPGPGDLPTQVWLLAVPHGRRRTDRVTFAARPVSLPFCSSDVARVEALVALHDEAATAFDGPPPPAA
jgi:hypothetical protein